MAEQKETSSQLEPITKVTILGAGQFGLFLKALLPFYLPRIGFAVAYLLASKNSIPIVLYDPIKDYIESIQNSRTHPVFHKGMRNFLQSLVNQPNWSTTFQLTFSFDF